ncbi:hypothetical protein SGPA1_50238 [Streptomyces misionensis JCM 4497]
MSARIRGGESSRPVIVTRSSVENPDCQWWPIPLRTHYDPPATERPWPLSPKEVGSTCVTTR